MLKTLIKAKIIPKITEIPISDRPLLENEYLLHGVSAHRRVARGPKKPIQGVRRLRVRRKAVEFDEH